MKTPRFSAMRFVLDWTRHLLAAWWLAIGLIWLLNHVLFILVHSQIWPLEGYGLVNAIQMVTSGLLLGGMMARTQQRLIESTFGLHITGWLRWSLIGALAGGLVSHLAGPHPAAESAALLVLFTAMSFTQWRRLRDFTYEGWLWVLANFSGAALYVTFLSAAHFSSLVGLLVALLIASTGQQIVTGVTLLWLLRHHVPDEEDDEYARAYVEVYNDSHRRPRR